MTTIKETSPFLRYFSFFPIYIFKIWPYNFLNWLGVVFMYPFSDFSNIYILSLTFLNLDKVSSVFLISQRTNSLSYWFFYMASLLFYFVWFQLYYFQPSMIIICPLLFWGVISYFCSWAIDLLVWNVSEVFDVLLWTCLLELFSSCPISFGMLRIQFHWILVGFSFH